MHTNGTHVWYALAASLAYFAFLGGMIYLSLRWSRRIMQRKSDAFGGGLVAAGARLVGPHGEGSLYRGQEMEYEVAQRRVFVNAWYISRSFVRANLRVPCAPVPNVTLFPEGTLQRLGKALHLNREVQLGDETFDRSVYIDSPEANDDHVRALLAPDAVRSALRELLAHGFKVEFSARGVEAFQIVYALTPLDGALAAPATALITRLADAVPRFEGATFTAPRRFLNRALLGVMLGAFSVGVALAIAGGAVRGAPLDESSVGVAMLLGGALWLIYMIGLVAAVRGTSSAFTRVLVGAFVGLLTLPLGGAVSLTGLNRALDDSPAEVHRATVRLMHRRDPDLHVDSWRPGHDQERLPTTRAFWRTVQVGDVVTVRVHPGRFGWAWVENVTERAPATATP